MKQREEMVARMVEMEAKMAADDAEDRGRKSVEDGPNVSIHA